MKNEFVLDFTGMTIDGAEEEITRYIRALYSQSPSDKASSNRECKSSKRKLENLKRIKRCFQEMLHELDNKIQKLEAVVDCDSENTWVEFQETENSVSELLRQQNAYTMYFLIDKLYSTAIEAKKQVRKSDIAFVTYYQSLSDLYSIANDNGNNCVFMRADDKHDIQQDTLLTSCIELLLHRYMQYNSVAQAERYYLYTTVSKNDQQDSEGLCTRAFRTMLASYLFEWRKKHGCTKQELSQSSGIERTTISNLETMRQSASIDKIIKLLQTTGAGLVIVPMGQILEDR